MNVCEGSENLAYRKLPSGQLFLVDSLEPYEDSFIFLVELQDGGEFLSLALIVNVEFPLL